MTFVLTALCYFISIYVEILDKVIYVRYIISKRRLCNLNGIAEVKIMGLDPELLII